MDRSALTLAPEGSHHDHIDTAEGRTRHRSFLRHRRSHCAARGRRRSGTIVNITSMGGRLYTPFGAWYHGTKYALEAVSDCLRLETRAFGIDVVVVEPGALETEWAGIAADHLRGTSGRGACADQAGSVADAFASEATARRSSPPRSSPQQ